MIAPTQAYRDAWAIAADFPPNKEDHYPGHADAQEFSKHYGKTVLEYGCGGGSDAMSFLRRGCHVTFVDIVEGNVKRAAERIAAAGLQENAMGIHLQESDRIAGPSGLYDVASAHGVIHHIDDPRLVLAEIRRLLKAGGLFYCMLYTEYLFERAKQTFLPIGDTCRQFCQFTDGHPGYARPYTEQEATLLLTGAGFSNVTVTGLYAKGDFRTFRSVAP